jgi:hypothetical protein
MLLPPFNVVFFVWRILVVMVYWGGGGRYDDSRGVGEPLNETTGITPYPNPGMVAFQGPCYLSMVHRM